MNLEEQVALALKDLVIKVEAGEVSESSLKALGMMCASVALGVEVSVAAGFKVVSEVVVHSPSDEVPSDHPCRLNSDKEMVDFFLERLPTGARNVVGSFFSNTNHLLGEQPRRITSLLRASEIMMRGIRNCGPCAAAAIQAELKKLGWRLGMTEKEIRIYFPDYQLTQT